MKPFAFNRLFIRYVFIAVAIGIAVSSLVVSNSLVKDLSLEERKKMEIWAQATQEMAGDNEKISENLIVLILENNTTIPVILFDKETGYYTSANIKLPPQDEQRFLEGKMQSFAKRHAPIVIRVEGINQYIYYEDSYTLKRLQWYPYIQLAVLAVFLVLAFFAVFIAMKREQDRVWVGLSKETAHQLGTPISSLMAWVEYLRLKQMDNSVLEDMEKDISRLEIITDRFSKIGSPPLLESKNIGEAINQSIKYLEKRISNKISLRMEQPILQTYANICEPLFGWVIENLVKNSADAMDGSGTIKFKITDKGQYIQLSIEDNGKGIAKSRFRTIFKPGYTTKSRGWGLGLSLAKRIIESYHKGKIYVRWSEPGLGTEFCIELKKVFPK